MTARERLAKVAEVPTHHMHGDDAYSVVPGPAHMCVAPVKAESVFVLTADERASLITAAEARGAARVREALEAHQVTLHDTIRGLRWSCTCRATGAGEPSTVRDDADDHLRAALDAAEKAAVGGVSVPTSEREGGNGPGHAGQVFGPSDRRTAAQEGDDYERGRHDAALAAAVALQGFAVKSFARLPNNPRGAALWDAASYLHPDDRNGLRVRRWESEYGADARSGQ